MQKLVGLALALATAGCGGGGACTFNSDCAAGSYCGDGTCATDCTSDGDCVALLGPGALCTSFGMCVGAGDAGPIDAGRPDAGAPDAGPACVVAGGTDSDADGFCAGSATGEDCDDGAAAIHPGATEACTPSDATSAPHDENCDGAIDESCDWHFGTPHWMIDALATPVDSTGELETPRLSTDGLRLYFRGLGTTGRGIFVATRASRAAPFTSTALVAVDPLTAPATYVSSFTLSADETELIAQVATTDAAMDLYRARRATTTAPFGTWERLTVLDTPQNDFHPFLRADGLELFFVSASSGANRIQRAVRASTSDPFMAPTALDLGTSEGESSPSLSADGLTLFFTRAVSPRGILMRASRTSTSTVVFDAAVEVDELNVATFTSRHAYMSERTREVFFVSNQPWSPGTVGLWRAQICRDGPCTNPRVDCNTAAGAVRSDDGLHCYSSSTTPATWASAEAACVTAGAHLASVQSLAERERIWRSFSTGTQYLWIGGTETGTLGTFHWVSGEPWLSTPWGVYLPTAAMQPDHSGGVEHCLDLLVPVVMPGGTDPGWVNDENCDLSSRSVCETQLWPTW